MSIVRYVVEDRLVASGRFWVVFDTVEGKALHVLGGTDADREFAERLASVANLAKEAQLKHSRISAA